MESIFTTSFLTLDMLDKVSVIAFYLSVVVVALMGIIGVLVNKYNKDAMPKYVDQAKAYLIGHIITLAAIFITLTITDMIESDEIYGKLFYPLLVLLVIIGILLIVGYSIGRIKPQITQQYNVIALAIAAVPTIAVVVFMGVYYPEIADWYTDVSQLGLYIGALVLILAVAAILVLCGKKTSETNSNSNTPANRTKSLSYGAVAIALSFALSYVKLFALPQGGSVTCASLLPCGDLKLHVFYWFLCFLTLNRNICTDASETLICKYGALLAALQSA